MENNENTNIEVNNSEELEKGVEEVIETQQDSQSNNTLLSEESKEESTEGDNSLASLLSDELKDDDYVKKFDNVEDLVKSAIHAQKLIGKKVSEYTSQDMEAIGLLNGAPKEASEYDLGEGILEEAQDEFKSAFHEAGVNKEQAKKLTEQFVKANQEAMAKQEEEMQTRMVDAKNELQKEFGSAYEQNIKLATDTIKNVGGDDLLSKINDSGLGIDPGIIKAFAKLGKDMGEHSIIKEGSGNGGFKMTPSEAQSEITSLMKDPSFYKTFSNPMATGHKEAQAKINELYKLKAGK